MKVFIITIYCCTILSSLFAQKEKNIWYFGEGVGIDFNSGSPVLLPPGKLNTSEGSSVMCDSTGKLLFYSDGLTLWNRNHQVMLNGSGLMGCQSSTQGVLIVPSPSDRNLYYVFTTDCEENNYKNGFRYSEVDMNLGGGLGGVVTKTKNILLHSSVLEKLAGIKGSCGDWVIVHGWDNSESTSFFAYRITDTGITSTPVVSKVGSALYSTNGPGWLQPSHDSKKLAMAISFGMGADIFDFDNATGVLSHAVNLPPMFQNLVEYYGACFSSDDSRLYISGVLTASSWSSLVQYNLLAGAGNKDSIIASQTVVGIPSPSYLSYHALQLGPDGKIYLAYSKTHFDGEGYLGVINNPNALGSACNFLQKGFYLGGRNGILGLPNFVEGARSVPTKITTCAQSDRATGAKPGDIVTIPISIENAKSVNGTTRITVSVTYDEQLLRIVDGLVSLYGDVTDYKNDESLGKLSFTLDSVKPFTQDHTEIASFRAQALLAPRREGIIEVSPVVIEPDTSCAFISEGCRQEFILDESCVLPEQLRDRTSASITSVYPNPSYLKTVVAVVAKNNPRIRLDIYDAFGRQMETLQDGEISEDNHEFMISTESYATGIYFCRLIRNGQITTKAFNVER